MAVLGQWTGGVIGIVPIEAWTAPVGLFPTEDRNDSSIYSFDSSTSTLILPSTGLTNGYLIVAAFEIDNTLDLRTMPLGRIVQLSGTGDFVNSQTGGYSRNFNDGRAYIRVWAFINNPSPSSTYQFQWSSNSDTPEGGTARSVLQVIPLNYSDIGMYKSTDSRLLGGTTPNQINQWTTTLDGANIKRTSDIINVSGQNKRYIVFGSQYFEGRGSDDRTQRWSGFDINGVQENAAKAYTYFRNVDNDNSGEMFTWLLETSLLPITISQICYRGDGLLAGEGGAVNDGSTPSSGYHSIVVIELFASTEVFRSKDTNESANLTSTSPLDQNIARTIDFNDSASFTQDSSTEMNSVVAMDVLLGANISAASSNLGSGARWTAYAEFTISGVQQIQSFAGDFLRNFGVYGWSANLLCFLGLGIDTFGLSVTQNLTSVGGGGDITSPVGWQGLWGINLDTIPSNIFDKSIELSYEVVTDSEITKGLEYIVFPMIDITKGLSYAVESNTDIAKGLSYEVILPTSITKALNYTVKTTKSIDVSSSFVVGVPVETTKSLQYAVQSITEVSKGLEYTVTTLLEISKGLQYSVLLDFEIQKSLQYHVGELSSIAITSSYSVDDGLPELDPYCPRESPYKKFPNNC